MTTARPPCAPCPHQRPSRYWSIKKILIQLLDVNHFLHPAANVEADHEAGQLMAVDENDALAEQVSRFLGGCNEASTVQIADNELGSSGRKARNAGQ
jgi:hypothetical protein